MSTKEGRKWRNCKCMHAPFQSKGAQKNSKTQICQPPSATDKILCCAYILFSFLLVSKLTCSTLVIPRTLLPVRTSRVLPASLHTFATIYRKRKLTDLASPFHFCPFYQTMFTAFTTFPYLQPIWMDKGMWNIAPRKRAVQRNTARDRNVLNVHLMRLPGGQWHKTCFWESGIPHQQKSLWKLVKVSSTTAPPSSWTKRQQQFPYTITAPPPCWLHDATVQGTFSKEWEVPPTWVGCNWGNLRRGRSESPRGGQRILGNQGKAPNTRGSLGTLRPLPGGHWGALGHCHLKSPLRLQRRQPTFTVGLRHRQLLYVWDWWTMEVLDGAVPAS